MINIDPQEFTEEVIELVEARGYTVMDAILDRCELYHIDPESVEDLISEPIKTKLKQEAISLNFFKKTKKNTGNLNAMFE